LTHDEFVEMYNTIKMEIEIEIEKSGLLNKEK